MTRRLKKIFVILLWLMLAGCREQNEMQATETPTLTTQPVSIFTVRLTPVPDQLQVLGTVIARDRADIASKVTGTISELPVELGSSIQKGDRLARINAGEIDARLRQSLAQLQQAKRNLAREQKLLAQNAATPETVKSLKESLAIAQAAFEEAQTMQGYTIITAPFAGTVTTKIANQGDLATPGKPLLAIENLGELQILTNIPEARSLNILVGDELPVTLPAAGLTITGKVVEIAPTADPVTRSAAVKLDIDFHPALRPGQFARVKLTSRENDALTVPVDSLVTRGQMKILFVISDDQAQLRLVRTGRMVDNQVEILSGLEEGEQVVTRGQWLLRDGQPVTIQ